MRYPCIMQPVNFYFKKGLTQSSQKSEMFQTLLSNTLISTSSGVGTYLKYSKGCV